MLRDLPRDRRNRPRTRPAVEPLEGRALLATLTVTNTLDSGAGSLRQAITDADAASGASTIDFAIPGSGVQAISPFSNLPAITRPVTIDGTTEPGYSGTPLIAIDGTSDSVNLVTNPEPFGLTFATGSAGGAVKGLAIDRFRNNNPAVANGIGIFDDGPAIAIADDSVGVDPSAAAAGNDIGIRVVDALATASGAGASISADVIGGNQTGISLGPAVNAAIAGNFIGTDAKGAAGLGNTGVGIFAGSGTSGVTVSNNTIANNLVEAINDQSGGGLTLTNNTLINNGTAQPTLVVATSTTPLAAATGGTITATFTVTNDGSATASGVELSLAAQGDRAVGSPPSLVPSPVLAITGIVASQGTAGIDAPAPPLAQLGNLAPGASATVTVTARIIGSGPDGIVATATAGGPTSASSVLVATAPVVAAGTADLAVVALAPPPARVFQPETFTFVVTNRDRSYSTHALFALQFTSPDGGTAITGALVGQGTVTALPAYLNGYGGDLGTLAPGASAVVTATIIPPAGGVVSAALYADSAGDVDPAPANNLAYAASLTDSIPTVDGARAGSDSSSGPITLVQVSIDGPVNVAEAQDVRNYALTVAGSTARLKIQSATYSTYHFPGLVPIVTLRLARSLPTTGAPLQLVVAGPGSPGLTGTAGQKLVNAGVTFTIPR